MCEEPMIVGTGRVRLEGVSWELDNWPENVVEQRSSKNGRLRSCLGRGKDQWQISIVPGPLRGQADSSNLDET